MNLDRLDGVYAENTDQIFWENLSPFCFTSDILVHVKGPVDFPISEIIKGNIEQFIETTVLTSPKRKLADFFPSLISERSIDELDISKNYQNILRSGWLFSWSDLASRTISELIEMGHYAGIPREDWVFLLAEIAISSFLLAEEQRINDSIDFVRENTSPAWLIRIQTLFEKSARFASLTGREFTPLEDLLSESDKDQSIQELYGVIGSLSASQILGKDQPNWNASVVFEELFQGLEERERNILSNRMFADTRLSLESVGNNFGITRERVRQLERQAKETVVDRFFANPSLAEVSRFVQEQIKKFRPLEELLDRHSFLSEDVPAVQQPVWRVLDRIDDGFEVEGHWCYVPDKKTVEYEISNLIESRKNSYGVVELADLDFITVDEVEQEEIYLEKWIDDSSFITYKDFLLTATSNAVDIVAAILSIEARVLSIDEILELLPIARSRAGLRDRLRQDARFVRADKDSWALADWGVKTYESIRKMISKAIVENDGSVRLDDLVTMLTSDFSISTSSILAYATTPPFETVDGVVRQSVQKRKSHRYPKNTARFYRRENSWIYRLRVNETHLKGFSVSMPMALASILDIQTGDKGEWQSSIGMQNYSWTGLSPNIGSIRRMLEIKEAKLGDLVFLIFEDRKFFDIEILKIDSSTNLSAALSLIGRESTLKGDKALEALAQSLDLSGSTSRSTVLNAFREKGDKKIYELLLESKEQLPERVLSEKQEKFPRISNFDISQLL